MGVLGGWWFVVKKRSMSEFEMVPPRQTLFGSRAHVKHAYLHKFKKLPDSSGSKAIHSATALSVGAGSRFRSIQMSTERTGKKIKM